MNWPNALRAALVLTAVAGVRPLVANEPTSLNPLDLKVPPGFSVELAAGPPLTKRPIVAALDDQGRLYVAESSGSNDKVEKQLKERPHRIVRLDDIDADGKFDKRTVFADRMMFPEGAQCVDGSLYVSAPPSIWKLTDANDDGIADERTEWFQGKTLTGCANDLHGPYFGPDGWLYWCKGAFAEQMHVVQGREWKTSAAHIFRSRLNGSGLEPVMTGGMDNPVDVVFTPEGERILSATLVVGRGRRDGILHAIYGGVYGKEHGVLDGHPRTGTLMPVFALMSPTAPCGLERYDSTTFGEEFRGNLFACQFNMRKVSRHVLRPEGSTFASADTDFVTCDNVDFHPTDVLMDADGSLLVFDTGGWYKLCCPTSQLWKPDVLGGIYRVRRDGATGPADPRGLKINWRSQSIGQLWALHADARPAVRLRASREIVRQRQSDQSKKLIDELGKNTLSAIAKSPKKNESERTDARTTTLARLWTLLQFDNEDAQRSVRELLRHEDASVRLAALNAVSLHRDTAAYPRVVELLKSDRPANRRAAAEALGRLKNASAVPFLLRAAADANDRVLQHSVIYALIELADADAIRAGLLSNSAGTHAAALVALDQIPGSQIEPHNVIPLLSSNDPTLHDTARWLVPRHTEWGGELSDWFREQFTALQDGQPTADTESESQELEAMLADFAVHPAIQKLIAESLKDSSISITARQVLLRAMAQAKLGDVPPVWRDALAEVIENGNENLIPLAIGTARRLPESNVTEDRLNQAILAIATSESHADELRVAALAVVIGRLPEVADPQFDLLRQSLSDETDVSTRAAAADALAKAPLSLAQLEQLCSSVETAGPLELNRILEAYIKVNDDSLGFKLLAALKTSSALSSLRIDVVRTSLAKYGADVQHGIDGLESLLNVDAAAQRERLESLLPKMAQGDVRRGHAVFHSAKAACSACHRLGYAGGTVGPELTRIGEIRTERDLLESILYPSKSFVQSYVPVQVVTTDGRTINGAIQDESEKEYVLVTGPNQEVRLARGDVEAIEPSNVSVMPGGLDQQLSLEELADLVAFLKNATGK
jgi:putative membrane-bound dehydrogenase-like protein